jgi:hypothetical protein
MNTPQEKDDRNAPKGKTRRTLAEIKADSLTHAGGRGVWAHEKGLHKHGKQPKSNTR